MRQGIISVLYKKGARNDPRNYRPITLLNNDYKILMRILTKRMNEAVVQFVSKDQCGFVPDAFIAENTMRLKLLQDYIEEGDQDALFIFLDMEKAFDRCSWEFLIEGLRAVGFGTGFIKYVELAYSTNAPPTRQLHVNGFLGPSFPLGSGVAQGCPLSPLLFLIIAVPLARMINNDPRIRGISVESMGPDGRPRVTTHKISQFADDSTLMLRTFCVKHAQKVLNTWCDATSMKENATKREVLLLGRTRRYDEAQLPEEIDRATIVKDGDTIRALGVPMGNEIDIEAWWKSRYNVVKARFAKWHGLGTLTLTGRNILVQSILYGSMRYWFFSLPTPSSMVKALEEDVKQLLWAALPEFSAEEHGTSKRSKRYIMKEASYLPQKQGGGGLMHIESHIKAFKAQWIIRYLDPRDAPWKDVLDVWTQPVKPPTPELDTQIGRGVILTPGGAERDELIPDRCVYMKQCFAAFRELGVTQDTTVLDHRVQGEPLFRNHRFQIQLSFQNELEWAEYIETYRLSDLMSDNGRPFTPDMWKQFIEDMAPEGNADVEAWKTQRMREASQIRATVPNSVTCKP